MFSFRKYFKIRTSYKELSKRVFRRVSEDNCTTYAAAMAYYLLFALFQFLLFLITLIAYIPVPHLMDFTLNTMGRILPKEAFTLLEGNIRYLFGSNRWGLLSLGFLLAIWSSSNAVTSLMAVMNKLYKVKEGRPFWKLRLMAILLIACVSVLFILSLVLLMFGPKIGGFLADVTAFGIVFKWGWNALLAPVVLFMLILAVALIYYITPDVEQEWKWISPGALFAIPIWLMASLAFSYYVNNFGSYNKTYGSIGAVIILLFWLYISAFIILVGADINSVVEHSSEEGKEPGEKVEGEKEAKG